MITQQPLEPTLRGNLLILARAHTKATGKSLATLSRAAHGDSPFFDTLHKQATQKKRVGRAGSFTVRKYDEVLAWFAQNWPDATPWPELQMIERPVDEVPLAAQSVAPSRSARRSRAR